MEKDKDKDTDAGTRGKFPFMWKYSLIIALTLIGGYILLVGILLYPIVGKTDEKLQAQALEAIKTITTVFGPWIAALVAFYFAGRQLENVSEQLGEAQKTISASVRPDARRILEGKFVKDIMDPFDPNKHKIPHPKLMNGEINSKTSLDENTIKAIVSHANELKDVKCFAVFTDKPDEIEGIITPADIKEIQTKGIDKKLEDFTTDMVRLIKVTPTQSLAEIKPSLDNFKVLPVFEGENIVGFVYRDHVFKLLSGSS